MYNDLWTSTNGSVRSFSAMDDEHLANVYLHLLTYGGRMPQIPHALYLEIFKRELTPKFLAGAPYPYKDKITKQYKIWDFFQGCDVVISG